MNQLLKTNRALSPVIAAVIMILVTTIGMTVLFAFFVNYSREYQLGSGSAVLESFVIEDVWFKEDPKRIQIWVYNIGKVNFTITSAYINDFQVAITTSKDTVHVGDHGIMEIEQLPSMGQGDNVRYLIKLVTTRGSAIEGSYYWE